MTSMDPSALSPPQTPTDPFANLPPHNPDRLLALLTSAESLISSTVQDFAGGGRGGLAAAAIAPMVPMLLEQATGTLRGLPGEAIDDVLLNVATLLLKARSSDAAVQVDLHERGTAADLVAMHERLAERPAHNED